MAEPVKIAIFASGSGSNFQALAEACQSGEILAEVALLVTDQPKAYAIDRAKQLAIPVAVINPKEYASKQDYEQAVLEAIQAAQASWVILAGYMRLIGETLLTAYPNKIINIHPSLLPSFPGKDAIGQAVAHGVKVTGVTVHYVDAGMDTGPIISQRAVPVVKGDAEATAQAIHQVEHQLYKETLQQILR